MFCLNPAKSRKNLNIKIRLIGLFFATLFDCDIYLSVALIDRKKLMKAEILNPSIYIFQVPK